MKRRRFLAAAGSASLLPLLGARPTASSAATTLQRVRPTDSGWPAPALWDELDANVGGQLLKVPPLLQACAGAPGGAACDDVVRNLRNPYFIGEQPAGTQTSGWVDGWRSSPSAYAVAAKKTADVAAAVNFARTHNLRVVVKGGGHSYQGTSNAPDSLLIWTRPMDAITLHDMFTPAGCMGKVNPAPAVSVQTGARWLPVYNAVTTKAGRYVQGGGCATVGVAGLVTGGGFGSFSKHYGMAAAGLLEAEVVTADGAVRIANACTHPDLFWALKGGRRRQLRRRDAAHAAHARDSRVLRRRARDDPGDVRRGVPAAHRALTSFYAEALFNPRWGEPCTSGRQCAGPRHGVPRAHAGRSRRGLEAVPRLGGGGEAGLHDGVAAPDHRGAGAALVGPRVPAPEPARDDHRRRAAECAGRSRVLGGQPGRGGILPARLRVGVAAGHAARAGTAGAVQRGGVRGQPALEGVACTSTRAWPARRRKR